MILGKDFVVLETLRRDKDNFRSLLFTDPVDIITCYQKNDILQSFRKIDDYRQKGFYVAGFLAYELGYLLEDVLNRCHQTQDYPLMWFGVYNKPRRLIKPFISGNNDQYYLSTPILAINKNGYGKNINKIKEHIGNGDTYQINYTTKYKFRFIGDIFAFYNRLKENQTVSYTALINYNNNYIISLSPELFFRTDKNRLISVKPMKGTADRDLPSAWLSQDEKNTSENVMIVDLLRNDLGRICQSGTVKVSRLFEVEEYETLWQMTSTISGKLIPQFRTLEIIKSLFPCGSVTGAPKINSMKIIRALEKEPRNIYTGAIGYWGPDNKSVFNVAIRTLDLKQSGGNRYEGEMGIGSGIVNDSLADEEYRECRLKAQFLFNSAPDFSLIETMLSIDGKVKFLDRHLRRLQSTAQYFNIPCNNTAIRQAVKKYAAPLAGRIRLRLLLNAIGEISLEYRPVTAHESVPQQIILSRHKTNSQDPFLYHKTTFRKLYDSEYKKCTDSGYRDVIFRNEKDEITEGAISNIFIRQNGSYYTPPLSCGLLNGIERQIMMEKLKAEEKILYLADLKKAEEIILTNSVRGATTVILMS
ncbi:MAG: aminodeoxychorismate synthase, component I [Syntrophaceae bacterium]|nr:aminodeoxychorismate synthase, component I [Syntrophaceae bacterium]